MEFIVVALVGFLGLFLGAKMRDSVWLNNSEEPMRVCVKGKFYKVVRLDSSASWKLLDIHEDEREGAE